jgi:hypothetical protein
MKANKPTIIAVGFLIIGSVFFVSVESDTLNKLSLCVKEKDQLTRYCELSEFYSLQAKRIWGTRSGYCSISMIKDIDTIVMNNSNNLVTTETILAIITVESGFNEKIKSDKGACGLMQLMLPTAKKINSHIDEKSIFIPKTNIYLGVCEFVRLIEMFNDKEMALLAYNRGSTGAKNFINTGRSEQENEYVVKVVNCNIKIAQAKKNM